MATVSLRFCTAKVAGEGEDADPILRVGPDLGLVGVFDGMGGAGGATYDTPDGRHTGAYLASRLARDTVEGRMLELIKPEWDLDGPATAKHLHDALTSALGERLAELKAPPSALRSKLVRALPTTMALAALQRGGAATGTHSCDVFWAGDSRVYALEPETGLRQLTTDDLRSGADAMRNLRDDSVMNNCVSADTEFHVSHRRFDLSAPFVVVAATDGCFGYLRSPMHFEHLLLSTLGQARDTGAWREALQARIGAVTGDDASLALIGPGADLDGLKKLLRKRTADLERRYIEPLDGMDARITLAEQELAGLRARGAELAAELWRSYKPGYEHDQAVPEPAGKDTP
jgi:serine/threonine protein phosphatase PrpC